MFTLYKWGKSIMATEWAGWTSPATSNQHELGFNRLLGAVRAKCLNNTASIFFPNQDLAEFISLKRIQKAAVTPADKEFPCVFKNNKDGAKANTVAKAVTVSTLKEIKDVKHCPFPYPYISGFIMGIASFIIVYKIFRINSNNKHKSRVRRWE